MVPTALEQSTLSPHRGRRVAPHGPGGQLHAGLPRIPHPGQRPQSARAQSHDRTAAAAAQGPRQMRRGQGGGGLPYSH
eukprot:15470931-Alexandrium_andersonii.AAC.1